MKPIIAYTIVGVLFLAVIAQGFIGFHIQEDQEPLFRFLEPDLEPCKFKMDRNGLLTFNENSKPSEKKLRTVNGLTNFYTSIPPSYIVGDCDYMHLDFFMNWEQEEIDSFEVYVYPIPRKPGDLE